MRVQVLEEATADLADGFRFYERQADGLGDYFLDSLWSDIQSLRLYGGIHAIHNGYHRFSPNVFLTPFTYHIEDGVVRVRAVLDCRRDPNWISEKLE